jgi:two-component system response regulator NreC
MADSIRLVLADDHAVVREGLRVLLESEGRMEVVAQAEDAEGALRYARGHKPDIVLLDLNMPGRDTLEVIPEILEAVPDTRVIVLTMHPEPGFARAAMTAGASGYVLKDASYDELLRAIEAAHQGQTYVDPTMGAADPPGQPDGLSEREAQVLRLIAIGHTNAEIAAQLSLSVRTVETHRAHIHQKTGRTGRADLVRYAHEHGLVGPS